MPIWKHILGSRKRVKVVWKKTASGWNYVSRVAGLISAAEVDFLRSEILTISSNTSNYNLFAALGNPTGPVTVDVTINSGVIVSSTSTSNPAFDTGAMPAGSRVIIINNGQIIGKGGNGGNGGSSTPTAGAAGGSAGDAINFQTDVIVDNTNGDIFGGGGGGGGGGGAKGSNFALSVCLSSHCGGGGGGGGAGNSSSSGGVGGNTGVSGDNGGGGSTSAGTGGIGGDGTFVSVDGGPGGNGGGYGVAGVAGSSGTATGTNCSEPNATSSGGSNGAAGKAVDLNGNSITWLGGNNSSQVKGAVS